MKIMLWILAALIFVPIASHAETDFPRPARSADDNLRIFLEHYLPASKNLVQNTEYASAIAHLRDNTEEDVIVYVTGRDWCGSGGCKMLVLVPAGASYKVVCDTIVTRLPIRLLPSTTNGLHDIEVFVAGGGIMPGYDAVLSFNGKKYPSNPTFSPARRSVTKALGSIVIPMDVTTKPL